MYISRNTPSPIALARSITPLWMEQIKKFDGLEVHPSKVIGKTVSGEPIIWPCEPEAASFWATFGRYKEEQGSRSFEFFEKFQTEIEAQIFCDRLQSVYPHLNGATRPNPKAARPFIPRIAV